MRRVDVRQSNGPPWGQCLNRIGGRPVLLAWPDDWLHEHAGQLAPNAPLTERICPGVKGNNLLEILGFRSVVQPDGHAKLASFCPAPHEDQVSDFEEKGSVAKIATGHDQAATAVVQAATPNSSAMKVA
jgi:hypothetical protein